MSGFAHFWKGQRVCIQVQSKWTQAEVVGVTIDRVSVRTRNLTVYQFNRLQALRCIRVVEVLGGCGVERKAAGGARG
jgi:hypothetical protein